MKQPTPISPYPMVHKTFKKEFKRLRDFIRSTNRYDLKKINGKTNIFEDDSHFKDSDEEDSVKDIEKNNPHYTVSRIEGCELTKIKEDKSSFAIGDKDGHPITPFDFIFVSKEVSGRKNKLIEVITKDGDSKYFSVLKMKIDECMGVGTLGNVAAAPISTSSTSQNGSSAEIQYKDVKDEILTPIKGKVPLLYGGARGGKKKRKDGRIY